MPNPHPKGARARVLLTSVFQPFVLDDEFGSRAINPIELYHNQVTREQGPCSLRMFHRSWGLMLIQENISAPSTLLDCPTRARFVRELTTHDYDVVGISGIVVNIGKVREMCRLVRQHSPRSQIVVGGHVTAVPGLETAIDADHVTDSFGASCPRVIHRNYGDGLWTLIETPMRYIPNPSGYSHTMIPAGDGRDILQLVPVDSRILYVKFKLPAKLPECPWPFGPRNAGQ